MASQSKAKILAGHAENSALRMQRPPPSARHDKDLSADQNYHPLDERIIAAAAEALDDGQTHYVDVPGIAPLRQAIADQLNGSFGADYESGNIIVTAGVQEARFLTIQKISENFDSIGLPQVVHAGVRKALGARPRHVVTLPVDMTGGGLPALDAIAAALEAGCRLLYLESPSRLTGAAYSDADMAQIAALLSEHGAAAICDQGLAESAPGGCPSLASAVGDSLALLGEAYPGMGLGSWHIGYIAAPLDWIPPMQSQKQIMAICTSTASQYAALGASEIYGESRGQRLETLQRQRSQAAARAEAAGIATLPGVAQAVLALRLDNAQRNQLVAAGYEYSTGADFGAPEYIRLSIGPATAAAIAAIS